MRRATLALLLVPLAGGLVARAEPPDAGPADVLAQMRAPASPEDVERLLSDPRFDGVAPGIAVVRTLARVGGHAAAEGLSALLDRREEDLQVEALRALGALGLRSREVGRRVRLLLRSREPRVRRAALEALGGVGDGRDVPVLLDALQDEEGATRSSALRALGRLSGARLRASPGRWEAWWQRTREGTAGRLEDALREVEEAVARGEDPRRARTYAERFGWLDLEGVERAALSWLRSADDDLRAEGLHLAAALRLADLAGEVRSALPFVGDGGLEAAARASRALGVTVPRLGARGGDRATPE